MATTPSQIPLNISIAPFPEGFTGDMDETFQQACILMEAFIEGQFISGAYLPPGSTLPSTDQGPIAMGGQWYFYDPTTGQYLPQTGARAGKNYAKNCVYQIHQTGSSFALSSTGEINTYDMAVCRVTVPSVLGIAADIGPPASGDTDFIGSSIRYTVGPTLVPTLAATDLFVHEHLFEGCDIAPLQGETLSLSFSASTTVPGTYSAYLTSSGRDMSYVVNIHLPAANTWYRVKISGILALPTSGTWHFGEGATGLYVGVAMGVGSQWMLPSASLGSWQPGFFAGSNANQNMLTVVNNALKITGIKLETSSSPSYMSVPSLESDYHDCIRYYWTNFASQSVTTGVRLLGPSTANGQANLIQVFPRRMCNVPIVVPYSLRGTPVAGNITDISSNNDIAIPSLTAQPKGVDSISTLSISTTGNTHTSTTIDGIPSTTGMGPGMPITGSGIPAGTTIATIASGTSVTISAATTSTLTGTPLTIYGVAKADVVGCYITADARLT